MGKKQTVEVLIEGGKATAAPPIGPTLGALKINIGNVVADINKKTQDYKGMKVPVKVIIDTETKEYEIKIGTPPTSQLIKKEIGIEKGSSYPNIDKVANLSVEQIIKIAKMKKDSFIGVPLKSIVKSIAGSCNAMGILVEGKTSDEFKKDVDTGKYDKEINEEKTGIPEEKKAVLKEQLDKYNKMFSKEREKLKIDKEQAKEKEESAREKKEGKK
jgi:large subunit ribosomal protein L11